MKYLYLTLFLILSSQGFAQISWNAELNLKGLASSEEEKLPFWMAHNQRGRIADDTNIAGWISGKGNYTFSNNSLLEIGVGLLARDGMRDNIFTDELYIKYATSHWSFTAGKKQLEELYDGLSASNRSILWSLNSRPLPGLKLETTGPVFFTKNFGFEATWEEYLMNDERFVKNTRLHHKNFQLVYRTADQNLELKLGLQHYAQWGGDSPIYGELPGSLDDYLKIITGRAGSENATEGDQLNALGNHLGGYEFFIHKKFKNYDIDLLYNHLFEDGSGSRLGNTPDGRYGIFVQLHDQKKWVHSFMYELYYTKHQSSTTTGIHKWDNYFNNFLYISGWTYQGNVIGAPFFEPNYYDEPGSYGNIQIGNNKFVVHHFGFRGMILDKPYRLLLTYRNNYGHSNPPATRTYTSDDPRGRFKIPPKALSSYLDVKLLDSRVDLNLLLGSDLSREDFNVGAGLHVTYLIK